MKGETHNQQRLTVPPKHRSSQCAGTPTRGPTSPHLRNSRSAFVCQNDASKVDRCVQRTLP